MARKKATIVDSLGRRRSASRTGWGKVRTLSSGRIQASYIGPDKNRHTAPVTFATRLDAGDWLATQRARIVEGTWTPAAATKKHERQAAQAERLSDYATHWIATRTNRKGERLRPRTREEYARLLAGPIAPLGALPLTAINKSTVREWFAALTGTGKATTAARAYGLLTSVLGTAADDGLIAVNPCTVRGASSASTGRKVTPPTAAELAIIEATMPERLRAAVVLAAWCSLRYGELTELRRKDVITQSGGAMLVNVERAVTSVTGVGFVVGPPKSAAGVRVVVLPAALAPVVSDHLSRFVADDPQALLFPATGGGHLAQSTFTKHWYPAREAAGRSDMPWHALRHYGATRYAQTGATLREVMARVGHSTPAAAMRYQHVSGRDAELADRMLALG